MKRREKDQRAGVSRLKAAGGLVNLCAREGRVPLAGEYL